MEGIITKWIPDHPQKIVITQEAIVAALEMQTLVVAEEVEEASLLIITT